jgi:hypothetical protein
MYVYVLKLVSDFGSEVNRVKVVRLYASAVPNDGITRMSELITKYSYSYETCFVVALYTEEYKRSEMKSIGS